MPITIAIGCHNHIFAEGLKHMLEAEEGSRIVGFFNEGVDYPHILKLNPNLFILDSAIFSELEALQVSPSQAKILLIGEKTLYFQEERVSELVTRGVVGILPPAATSDLLKKAIKAISGGELWFDRKSMSRTIDQGTHTDRKGCRLTSTEREVVALICQGYKNKEIAVKLGISELTVKSHCTRAFKKVKVTDRLQLAVQAYKYWPDLVFNKPSDEQKTTRFK